MVFKDSKIRGGEKAVPQKGAQNQPKWSPKKQLKMVSQTAQKRCPKSAKNQELLALREIRVVRNLSTVGASPEVRPHKRSPDFRVVASIPTQWPCGGYLEKMGLLKITVLSSGKFRTPIVF